MLHEKAIAWIRNKERAVLPTTTQLGARLKRIASEINAEHDVAGLCRKPPARVEKLRLGRGRKLRK